MDLIVVLNNFSFSFFFKLFSTIFFFFFRYINFKLAQHDINKMHHFYLIRLARFAVCYDVFFLTCSFSLTNLTILHCTFMLTCFSHNIGNSRTSTSKDFKHTLRLQININESKHLIYMKIHLNWFFFYCIAPNANVENLRINPFCNQI